MKMHKIIFLLLLANTTPSFSQSDMEIVISDEATIMSSMKIIDQSGNFDFEFTTFKAEIDIDDVELLEVNGNKEAHLNASFNINVFGNGLEVFDGTIRTKFVVEKSCSSDKKSIIYQVFLEFIEVNSSGIKQFLGVDQYWNDLINGIDKNFELPITSVLGLVAERNFHPNEPFISINNGEMSMGFQYAIPESLEVRNVILMNGDERNFTSSEVLSVAGDGFIFQSRLGSNVVFESSNEIVLQNGFYAVEGSEVVAKIVPSQEQILEEECPQNTSSYVTEENSVTYSVEIFPNPISDGLLKFRVNRTPIDSGLTFASVQVFCRTSIKPSVIYGGNYSYNTDHSIDIQSLYYFPESITNSGVTLKVVMSNGQVISKTFLIR